MDIIISFRLCLNDKNLKFSDVRIFISHHCIYVRQNKFQNKYKNERMYPKIIEGDGLGKGFKLEGLREG